MQRARRSGWFCHSGTMLVASVGLVQTTTASSREDVERLHDAFGAAGCEGPPSCARRTRRTPRACGVRHSLTTSGSMTRSLGSSALPLRAERTPAAWCGCAPRRRAGPSKCSRPGRKTNDARLSPKPGPSSAACSPSAIAGARRPVCRDAAAGSEYAPRRTCRALHRRCTP